MKNSGKNIFEKSISRDWSIITAQIWNQIYTSEFKKQFGWGYKEVILEGKEGQVTVYRIQSEHIDGMRNFILNNLSKDKNWMKDQSKMVEKFVSDLKKYIDSLGKDLSIYSSKENQEILEKLFSESVKIGPRYLMMLWFPIQMENNPEVNKYSSDVKAAILTREKIDFLTPLVDIYISTISKNLFEQKNIPVSLIKYVSYEELIDLCKKKQSLFDLDMILKRKKQFLVTSKGIKSNYPIEKYLTLIGGELEKIESKDLKEFSGQIAYRGKIEGIVKIIKNKEQFSKFEIGDVLVASMTTPDFISILKKASAFVTDEGGITCHASIVARELKKPCIIGTKIATKVLKDGDLVEVDAEKGIVRIIK